MFDCTSFVFLLLARHSPQAASALNMTVAAALRKEVNNKRSAVKNLSTYTFIQILRRSAPQNDKLLNCSQTPRQTGICNWRQRGKDGGKRCSGRSRLAEINTGFSRASRSPALRRLANTRPAGFGTRTPPVPLSKPIKPAVKQPQTNNEFLLILPRHYAASGLLNLHAPHWYKP